MRVEDSMMSREGTSLPKNLFVAGSPGVGKTSLVKEATFPFRDRVGGFYTEQVTVEGKRVGFRLVTFDGRSAVLASKSMTSPARINKYGVDLAALEGIGVRAIDEAAAARKVVVIDEIGAMEALSDRFRASALSVLQGPRPVLATVRAGTHDFSDSVKRLAGSRLIELRRENYQPVKREVDEWLQAHVV